MRLELVVALGMSLAACSEKRAPAPATEPAPRLAPADAGVTPTGSVVVGGFDSSAMHLDEGGSRPFPEQPSPARERRPIDVTLRSTPSGAQVAIDGTAVGMTPAFWNGYADGREHEFVFTLRGHAIARYRFVPVTSGVIHARLDPIAEDIDAGVPPPEVVPPRAPAVAPPPTIIKPVEPTTPPTDAAPRVEPAMPGVGPQP